MTNELDDRERRLMNPHQNTLKFLAILQTEDKIKTVWNFRAIFCYHCKVLMVFKGTITIEWNGLGQPLGSMVFRWFWGHLTIGFTGF